MQFMQSISEALLPIVQTINAYLSDYIHDQIQLVKGIE